MQERAAEFAVVGAGPAGAHLASRLAAAGREVLLFDPKGAWEKPCGGGVPTRALREFSFILESSDYPKKLIRNVTLVAASGRRVRIRVKQPFAVFSREVLNRLVLDRALASGARFVQEAVTDFKRENDAWQLRTAGGRSWRARFLIGADGAASPTRRKLVGIFPRQDIAVAFGYNIAEADDGNGRDPGDSPCDSEEAVIYFPPEFTGYAWAFPRPGAMNFGVAAKLGSKTTDELRRLLTEFVGGYYGGELPAPERMTFFGAKIPTLDAGSWQSLPTAGEGWALVGDAAGFTDPITGEGIYFAFRSAELLAEVLLAEHRSLDLHGAAREYERSWREYFGRELEKASRQVPMFYRSQFLGAPFPNAMIFLAAHHRGVRDVLINALLGEQSYLTLKRDLLSRAYQVI